MYMMMLMFLTLMAILDMLITSSNKMIKMKKKSIMWSLVMLVYFNLMITLFKEGDNFQLNSSFDWFNKYTNLNWGNLYLSMDGMSMFFMELSMLLIPMCMAMSWDVMKNLKKEFVVCLFVILALLIGVFSMLDILGFYILFESMLMPMFLMMGMWGSSEEKVSAAFYFFFYTLIGSLLMLISMFKLYSMYGSTNYLNLIFMELPSNLQIWMFLGFFASLAVKMPMIPVHMWLPQAHVEAPVAGSVLLAGMLLKLGGYGFMSFGFPIYPLAAEYFSPMMMMMSLVAMVYGSFTTCSQNDMKSLMAYSSVSHMGLVTLAMFTHSMEGLIASMMMMMAHGLVSSALFMTSSVLYISHHSSMMSYFSGMTITMPMFSMISFLLILANIGFPLTMNFIAEFFSILAALNYSMIVGVMSCMGALLSTVYALFYYNSMYFGTLSNHVKLSSEITEMEFQAFTPLMMLTMLLGMFPNMIINFFLTSSFMNISL